MHSSSDVVVLCVVMDVAEFKPSGAQASVVEVVVGSTGSLEAGGLVCFLWWAGGCRNGDSTWAA